MIFTEFAADSAVFYQADSGATQTHGGGIRVAL